MHLGSKNPKLDYTMVTERNERIKLKPSRVERDLVVKMNHDMKWASLIDGIVQYKR